MQFRFLTISAALLAAPLLAQSERALYRVDFAIRDGSEPAKQARRYFLLLDAESRGYFRGTTRVPYAVPAPAGSNAPAQYNFTDAGFTIECDLKEAGGRVTLNLKLDLSLADTSRAGQPPAPTHVVLNVRPSLALGKPAVVASVDDPVSMRKMEFEATVTKLN